MTDIKLQKGNLFNPLTGYFDFNLTNSSEYDLEVSINGKKDYYRIRFRDFEYVVSKLKPSSAYEFIKPDSLSSSPKDEVLEFIKSKYYKTEFKDRYKVANYVRENRTRKFSTDASYANYFASLFQKNKFSSEHLCSFYVDSDNWNKRDNVSGYKVDIELVRNRYYIVFLECFSKEFSIRNNNVLWFVYDKEGFMTERDYFEEDVVSLSSDGDYPLKLTESIMLLTGCNLVVACDILERIKKYKDSFKASPIKDYLQKEFLKGDTDSLRNSLIKIFTMEKYQKINFALEHNELYVNQLIDFIVKDSDDIEEFVSVKKKLKKL